MPLRALAPTIHSSEWLTMDGHGRSRAGCRLGHRQRPEGRARLLQELPSQRIDSRYRGKENLPVTSEKWIDLFVRVLSKTLCRNKSSLVQDAVPSQCYRHDFSWLVPDREGTMRSPQAILRARSRPPRRRGGGDLPPVDTTGRSAPPTARSKAPARGYRRVGMSFGELSSKFLVLAAPSVGRLPCDAGCLAA